MRPFARNFEFERVADVFGTNAFAEQILRAFALHFIQHLADATDDRFGYFRFRDGTLVNMGNIGNRRPKRAEYRPERKNLYRAEAGPFGDTAGKESAISAIRE